jgi:pyruvate/2-oxoacid:ferredoxin oxidoreductase beta subunit
VAISGDGATFDIGFGSLAGMLERGDDVLYICADNDAYWNFLSRLKLDMGRLGVNCGLVPLSEMVNGKITKLKKLRGKVPVIEYIKHQKRFQHLVEKEASKESLMAIQEQEDRNSETFKLMG